MLIGKRAAEKLGLEWALTSFMNKAWDTTKEELSEKGHVHNELVCPQTILVDVTFRLSDRNARTYSYQEFQELERSHS